MNDRERPSLPRRDLALVFFLALGVRLVLLFLHPGIHGGDSVARLAHADRLVLAYQLPLPQALVALTRWIWPNPVLTQIVFAVIGTSVALGLAAVVGRIESAAAGRVAGLFAALHPLFLYYSLVPYQEGPMLALLLGGAAALCAGRDGWASLLVGLACLCRYEAWPAAALIFLGRRRLTIREILAWSWAPLVWMAFSRGLSPAGTYVLDLDASAGRIRRLPFLLGKVHDYSGTALVLLAAAGALVLIVRRGDRRWLWGAAWVVLVLGLVVAAGHETPPGSGLVSERLAHAPVLALCGLAAVAVSRLSGTPVSAVIVAVVVTALGLSWVRRTDDHLRVSHEDPALRLAMDIARAADTLLPPGGRLLVVAQPVSPAALADYVDKVSRAGGDTGKARAVAKDLAHWSPDADRIAAHLPRRVGTVVLEGEGPALVAVFDDAPGAPLWTGPVVARFEHGDRGATLRKPQ